MKDAPLSREKQALVTGVLRLIQRKVTDLAPWATGAEREDLLGAASVGATVAAARFESSYGTRFTSYATPYICGAIKDFLTAERRQRANLEAASLSGREFMAEQSDTFKVIWDTPETNRTKLETLTERLFAAMFAGVAGAALANPEEVVIEAGAHERAVELVKRAVEQGPARERDIFRMRYEERQTMGAIAKALGVDESTVRRNHERLLDRISALLHEDGITSLPLGL